MRECDLDDDLRRALTDVGSSDRGVQNAAYQTLTTATDGPVAWAYEAWDELVAGLRDRDRKKYAGAGRTA